MPTSARLRGLRHRQRCRPDDGDQVGGVACGFFAGDANTMHSLGMLAKAGTGVSLGVHPGFNDLWASAGKIEMDPRDLELMVAYQIGALQAMARYAGLPVTHQAARGAEQHGGGARGLPRWRSAGRSRRSTTADRHLCGAAGTAE